MANAEPVRARRTAEAGILFEQLLGNGAWENVGLVRSDGMVLASALPVSEPIQLKDRSWFTRMQQTGGFAIGDYQVGRITGQPTLNVAFPLPGQSKAAPLDGVFAALNLKAIQGCVSLSQLPPKAVLLVVDRNGTYLARSPGGEQWVGKPSHSWAAFQAGSGKLGGFVEAAGVDGIERLYHYQAVPGTDESLFVAVGVSKAAIQSEARAGLRNSLFWLGLYTLASVLATSLIANGAILNHVRSLTAVSQRLAEGDLSSRAEVTHGALEFQNLGVSFNVMATALESHRDQLEQEVKERTAELRAATAAEHKSRIMLARILDSVPQAVFWKDRNSVYLGCNKVFARTVGLAEPAEIIGKTDFDLPWPRQDAEGYVSDDREVMENNRSKVNYLEQEQLPDGTRRWVSTTKVPLADETGRSFGVLGVYDDVTERIQAELNQQRIIQELQTALAQVKTLSGLLPICSGCKQIRDDRGYWSQLEAYISQHTDAQFSHGLCPACANQFYPEYLGQLNEPLNDPEPNGEAPAGHDTPVSS